MITIPKHAIRTVLISVVLLTSSAMSYTVLWDTSHGLADSSYNPSRFSGKYQDLAQALYANENQFVIQTTSSGFTTSNLSSADIAVVCAPTAFSSAYTQAEINTLTTFVNHGGGLLIMGDTQYANYQSLGQQFGFTFGQTISEYELNTTNLTDHPANTGINEGDAIDSVTMVYLTGLTLSGNAQGVVLTPDGTQVMAASATSGAGRIFALGDSTLWTTGEYVNDFAKADNEQFAINVFEHLVDTEYIPEPATLLLLLSGSVLLRRKK